LLITLLPHPLPLMSQHSVATKTPFKLCISNSLALEPESASLLGCRSHTRTPCSGSHMLRRSRLHGAVAARPMAAEEAEATLIHSAACWPPATICSLAAAVAWEA